MANLRRISLFLWIAVGAAVLAGAAPAQQPPADGDAALRSAQALFNAGKWRESIRAFEDFQSRFAQHPQAINAPFNIAEAQVQLGEFESARSLLIDYLEQAPDEERKALALFRIGECSFFLNEYDRAHKDLETFRSLYPNHEKDAYAIAYLGDVLLSPSEFDPAEAKELFQEAIKKYEKATSRDPAKQKQIQITLEECKLGLARAQAAAGEIPAAISTFKRMADDPKNPLAGEARVRLGRLFFDSQRYDEAVAALKPFEKAAKSPNRNWGLYWLGRTYLERRAAGDDALAVSALKSVHISSEIPEEPPVPAVSYFLGEAYRAGGQLENALGRYEKAFYDYQESEWADDAFLGAMRAALDLAKTPQDYRKVTVDYFSTASRDFTNSPLYPYMEQLVGQAFLKTEKYNDAQSIFAKLTQRYPSGAAAGEETPPQAFVNDNWLFLALSEIGLRRADKAVESLRKIAPTADAGSDFQMAVNAAAANANVLLENYRDAIAPLEEYLQLRGRDSDAPRYYELLALCQIMTKQPAAAHRTIDALRKLDPDLVGGVEPILKAEQKLAVVAVKQKEIELARSLYTMLTFRENPQSYIDFGKEGLALLDSGRVPSMEGESPEVEPVSGRVGAQEAFALFQEGLQAEEQEDVNTALEKYVTVYTDYAATLEAPKALLAAGRILDRGQQDKEATQLLSKLVSEYREFPQLDLAYYRLAWTRLESGDLEGGQEAFQRLVQDFPNSTLWADAAYRVAEYESASNRRDVANRLLDDILRQSETAPSATRLLDHVLYLRGQNAFVEGKWTVVEKYMRRLLEETPESSLALSARYWLAEAAYKGRDWETAQQRFRELATAAEGRTETWLPVIPLRLAQILAWTKRWPEAYDAAIAIQRDYPDFDRMHEVDYLIGRCFTQAGKFTDARKHFEQVIAADGGKRGEAAAMSQWMIGETYFRQKEYQRAIDAYDKVQGLYRHPYWQAVALLQIGKCYLQLGDGKLASAAFDELLKRFPESPYAENAAALRKAAYSDSGAGSGAGSGSAATRDGATRYR